MIYDFYLLKSFFSRCFNAKPWGLCKVSSAELFKPCNNFLKIEVNLHRLISFIIKLKKKLSIILRTNGLIKINSHKTNFKFKPTVWNPKITITTTQNCNYSPIFNKINMTWSKKKIILYIIFIHLIILINYCCVCLIYFD